MSSPTDNRNSNDTDINDGNNDKETTTTTPGRKLPPVVDRIAKGNSPICVIVVGMAGSGKTTLMAQLQRSTVPSEQQLQEFEKQKHEEQQQQQQLQQANEKEEEDSKPKAKADNNDESTTTNKKNDEFPLMPAYCINLDPATLHLPYNVSIDIRDTVDYKQVMKQHNLGPNGAIMTSLNLFATKFDQVISILESRADQSNLSKFLLVDTPGQIEAFTWSASGSILSESLASTFPTVLVFVVDTVRCAASPNTFMSNMLYACSMYYRTRLPLVICFNKTDVVSHEFVMEWMKDYEAFQEALDAHSTENSGGFYDSLTRSLSLVLDEFYTQFQQNACGVSAVTGDGMADFWLTVERAATTDFDEYIQDLKYRIEEQDAKKRAISRVQAKRLQRDLES